MGDRVLPEVNLADCCAYPVAQSWQVVEFSGKHLFPFSHGSIGRAMKGWPIKFGSEDAENLWLTRRGKLSESAVMEISAIVGA